MSFDVQQLAFETVAAIGKEIRVRIEPKLQKGDKTTVQLIYLDRMLRGGLDLLSATATQLENLKQAFESAEKNADEAIAQFTKVIVTTKAGPETITKGLAEPAVAPSGGPVAPFSLSAPQSALNILGLLTMESHYFGRTVTIPEEPFLLELSSQLRSLTGVKLFHPALFTPWSSQKSFTLPASIRTGFDQIMGARHKALRSVKRLMAIASALKHTDRHYGEMRFASDQAREQYEAADLLLKELNQRLSQKDDAVGASGMQMLVRAAAIVDIFDTPDTVTYILLARMEAAGGAYRTVRSLSRLIFGGDGIDYAAGVIASFGLFNLQGNLIESGIVTAKANFRAIQERDFLADILAPLLILGVIAWVLIRLTASK